MKTVADELKKVDKMVYEEGKEMEALHLLETLETSPELDGDEQLQVKILKSAATLWNYLLIPEERWREVRKLANQAFTEAQQHDKYKNTRKKSD